MEHRLERNMEFPCYMYARLQVISYPRDGESNGKENGHYKNIMQG